MSATNSSGEAPILYCHCKYAKVVPVEVKERVLAELARSGRAFEAVADLCEMSARKDPAMARLAEAGTTRIAACFPRAVQWLFHAAGAALPDGVEVLNMREQEAGDIVDSLLGRAPVASNRTGEEAS